MPIYKVNGDVYNIPKEKAGAFEERYPNASVSYSSDGDKYDIPLSKKAAFMNRYPKATLYSEEDKNDDLPNEMVVDSSSLSPSPSPTVESNNKTSPVPSPSSRFVKGKGKDTTIFGVPYNVYTHMKPETQSYYHQKALDDEKRNLANNVSQQAGEVQMQAEDAYDRRYNKLEAEELQFREEHPFLSFIKDLANAGRPVPIPPTMEDKDTELRTLQGVVENARTTKQTIDESGEKGNTTFFGGLGRGMRDMAGRGSTWDMGVLDLNRNFAISTAANKYLKGEELDDTEKILLRSAAIEHVANNEFAGDFGRGYKMGQTTVQSLPFMAEFLINPLSGSGKAIGKGMLRQGLKVVGKELPAGMLGKVVNGTTRIMGDVTAASGMALTTGSARTTADFVDRQNGAADYEVDNDGNIQYSGQEGGVGLGEAAYKAIASQTIENFSEMAGGYFNAIGKGVGNLVGKAMEKSSLLNRLGNTVSTSKVADLYRNISSSQLAKTITDFERNTGYHGTIEEYGEEVAGTVLNAIFTGDQSFSDLGDIDQQIDTFLGVCGIGGLFSTIKAVGYRTPVHQANRELGKIGKQLSHSMGDEWNDVSQALQDASVEDRKQYLTNIIERDDISDETKLGLFQYVGTLTRRDAIKSGKVKQVSEGEEQAENVIVDDEAEENYEAGYNAVNPQERNEAKLLLEQSASEVQHLFGLDKAEDVESVVSDLGESPAKVLMSMNEKGYSQDEISVISSFLNAKETYNGVIDNVKDGIDNEIATQIDYIDKNTHQDGSLYNATMKVDDRNVYVTGGNVVLDEENNIDHEKSDTSIVIRDASTGKVEMVDVRDIFSVKTGVNAEQHKAEITEQIRQDYAQRAANEINGVLSFAPGDVYDVINPATGQLSAINVIQDNGDGTVIISDESGTQAQSTKDEIQAMAEQANIAKMNEHRLSQQLSKYALNNEVIIPTREGPVRGFVTAEKDADGLIEVMTESPINGKKVNVFTEEELKQLTNDVSLADNVESSDILSEQEVQEPVATVQVEPESAIASEIQPVEEQSIPVDDKGNMLYHKAPVELTIADLNDGNLTTDEVDAFVTANKEEATKQLKKISDKPPKVGTNKAKYLEEKKKWNDAVADINSQVAYWKEVEAQLQAIREQPGDTTASEIKAMGEPLNGSELAAIMLGAGKLPLLYNDYKRETGFGNSDARGMFGMFSTKENGGMTIEQAGEQLMLADLEAGTNFFDQNDPNEGRNAIIDVLSSARTRSGLINYIKSNREAMAERERQAEVEADELAKEQWYQDYYHMTPEEYELWNQGELFAESNMISDEDHQELMSSFTDEILKEQENDRRISQESGSSIAESENNEQGRISGVRKSGGSVLQGEESVPTGRTGGIEEESGQIDANSGAEYDALQGSTSGGELGEKTLDNESYSLSSHSNQTKSENGTLFEPIPQRKRRTEAPQDSRMEEAAAGLRDRIETAARDAQTAGGTLSERQSQEIEQRSAESYAKETGQWIPMVDTFAWHPMPSGNENNVYLNTENGSVYKVNNLMNSKRILSLFSRIRLHNQFFPSSKYEFVGFTGFDKGSIFPVLKQDYVHDSVFATPEEIESYMQSLGFHRIGEGEYSNRIVTISDLRPRNVLKDSDGDIYVVDADFKENISETSIPSHMEGESLLDYASRVSDAYTLHKEEQKVDTNPTDAQKEAGNYKKGHIKVDGFDITIENPRGSERSGVGADGKSWSVTMNNTYGYIRGTEGVDGDHIDVFLGDSGNVVYVVDQVKEDGSFDEHKVMYGFGSVDEAKEAYLSNYSTGWKGLGNITGVSKEAFREWIDSSHRKIKPFNEYKSVRGVVQSEVAQSAEQTEALVTSNESETKDAGVFTVEDVDVIRNNPLTVGEIESSAVEPELKTLAKDYLAGNESFINLVAYQNIYNDVRNRTRGFEPNSTGTGETQLDEVVNGNQGGLESGFGRGEADNVGAGRSETPVSGSRRSGKTGTEQPTLFDGERGDHEVRGEEPAVDGVSPGRGYSDGGGRAGGNGRDVSRPTRGKTGSRGTKNDTGRRTNAGHERVDSVDKVDRDLQSALDDFKDILNQFGKAGKNDMSLSLVGLNKEQIQLLPRLVSSGVKLGYQLIRKEVYDFKKWAEQMRSLIGDPLKQAIGYGDTDVNAFIQEMWNSKFEMDGEVHTLAEWSAKLGTKELKKQVNATLEEKRAQQMAAESIPVRIADAQNIDETLPYLLPQQREDVRLAEVQFFDESHQDREHGNGKGYLFTNGTGTGKTYTGLGIVKRFIKQGKNRILVVTPSQPKVTDWIKDAGNLDIELRDLDTLSKEKGTTATTEKGEGAVITTFANLRQNKALLEDTFDLIVYDESHRIMENKQGEATIGADVHFMITNRNADDALRRYSVINPKYQAWQKAQEVYNKEMESSRLLMQHAGDNEIGAKGEGYERRLEDAKAAIQSTEKEWREEEERLKLLVGDAVKTTKTVFLSATPFNTRESLTYTEGYIFSFPEENTNTVGSYHHHSPQTEFYLTHFGAGYKFRYGRLERGLTNADALVKQEVAFSDYLENELGTKSGRIIDSEYDYSRDFPMVTLKRAQDINDAIEGVWREDALNPLSDALRQVWFNYNYTSALLETMKISATIPRIREHLKMGRKVVIFHRRVQSKAALNPPFKTMLSIAREQMRSESDAEEKKKLRDAIALFEKRHEGLLQYEQTLNYSMPREQIAEAFGEENVLFFSGQESGKTKNKAVEVFNDDDSGKNIIVIQEASGKEGISLHDTSGKHQRVIITLALPQSPITALQIEGRIYRIGNKSNAIFEYPLLGLDSEMILFGQQFNQQVSTTENLALGSKARDLRSSFTRGVEEHTNVPLEQQGLGGKEFDKGKLEMADPYEDAVLDYYGNQKVKGRRDNREGMDYFATPEPVGFKMVEWAMPQEGESALEPSAGHGAIARYVSHDVSLTAIEPSNSLFGKLQLRAGGMGRKFVNDLFENYAFQNKHDVIVMNPPFGTAGKKAMDHLEKAFDHLTEGGRVVALIPRGQMDKRFEKWYGEKKEAVVTAEINLPSCTFEQAGTSVYARVVVIDRIGREETRRKAPYRRNIDLSGIKTVKELFERLKDVEVPGRTIDEVARNMKNAKKTIKEFKEIKGVDVIVDTDGIYAYGRSGMTLFSQRFDSESMANIPNEYARMHYWIEANGTADMGNRAKEQIEVYFTGMKTLRNLTGKTHELLMKESEGGKNILPAENTTGTGVVSEQQRSGDKYSYKEDRNTKTGEVMHLAIPLSKDLDRELYLQMVSCAKRNDGYWNRFKKAFHFQTKEGADAFIRESVTIGEGGNVRFRLPDSEGGNGNPAVEQGEIKAEVEELADTLHTPIRIVRDTDEISDSNKGLEQRKKQSKGWFDSETSEVVLVLPNAKSVEDAMATVLHEIVGHSGLRAVFGNKFDEFIERVFHGANQSTRQKIVELAAKNNWNFHLATEEYLARLAEKGFESNRGFWTKVRSIFMNIIHEAKLRLGFRISDNDLRYALWRTYQLQTEGKGGIQEADNIDMQQRLRVGNFSKRNSWLLFRDGPVTEGKVEKTMARYLYESQTRKRSYKFKEAYQDSMLGLKKFMEAVSTATGEDIADHENAYMAENQMSSRSTYETEFYKDNFFTPMMKAVAALINKGFDYNEIVDYMVAKHGIERNRELSVRDAILSDYKDEPEEIKRLMNEYHEQRDKVMELFKNGIIKKEDIEDKLNEVAFLYTSRISDYSGLSSLTGEEEEYENAARTLVSDMEEDNLKETQVLWDKVNAATKETLRKNYDSGMITKETYEKVSSMFMNYIPLRGWKEDTAADVYSYLISERSIFNAPVKAAVGRKSLADDPLATIGNMAESAILQGNRNLMKQKFLNLVINHPTELATVKEMWYVLNESTDEWEQSLPNIPDDATPEEVQNVIDEHERRMLELIRDKRAKKGRLDVPYKTLPPERKEHTVIVRRNGKEFTIFINGNPRVAQAVNGLTNPDATSHRFMQWVGRLNRQMSANFTTRNPAFVLSNLSRDLIFSSTAIAVKENRKYSARFMKNIAANLKDMCGLMQRHERGTLNLNNPKDKYFHEFLQYGGETGYTNLHSVDEYKKLVDRQIMDAQGKVDIGRIFGLKSDKFTTTTTLGIVPAFQFVAKWTEFCNRCAEDTSRFATYMTSREMGRSVLRSISDAKEVTVNFNKKGAGGYGATTFKNLYLFFNAAVQSLQNFGGLAKKNPKKFAVALSSFTAAGILLPMLNQMLISMFGDDDDKDAYNNLPEWVRKNNLCFWTGGKKFVTIPLPIELRAFYGTGEIFHSLMNGDNVGRNWGMALVGQFAELLPINPLGNEDAISTIVPDAGKPLYQAMINKDYFGSPIYKDSDYNKLMPEWTKAYTGTSKALVSSTDLLNELTGGDKYTRGWLNANPALIEHYFESYFGGMGKTINQLGKTISMIWDEDERIMRNIPVANRFLSNENERNAFSRVNEEYYYFLEEFKETGQRLRGYEKEANKGILEYAEKEDFLYNSPKYERYEIMKDYQKDIMGIREEIKEIEDELTRKDLELLLNLTKMELVDELRSVK